MKKVSLMFKSEWKELNVNVMGYRVIGELKDYPGLYKYSPGADIVTLVKGKEPIIRTQEEVAVSHLNSGKGVIYKDFIMFLDDEKNKELKKFDEEFKKAKVECEKFLDGKVSNYVADYYNFPVLKFLLTMFKTNMFSEIVVREKLSNYILPEGIDIVMAEFISQKEGQ